MCNQCGELVEVDENGWCATCAELECICDECGQFMRRKHCYDVEFEGKWETWCGLCYWAEHDYQTMVAAMEARDE